MTKTIVAIRNYPMAIALAMLLLLTLLLNTGSVGKTPSGGGDDGSGMGGTGRADDIGGSGMGGTGSPLPYFGLSDDEEADEPPSPSLPPPLYQPDSEPRPVSELADGLRQLERNRTPSIDELYPEATEIVADGVADVARRSMSSDEMPIAQPAIERASPEFKVDPRELIEEYVLETQPVGPNPASSPESHQLAETAPAEEESAEEEANSEQDRRNLPEKIQRPDLPPFQRIQRVRPVERITIVPPRVQPMRI